MMSPFHCLCLTVLLALIARLMCVCVSSDLFLGYCTCLSHGNANRFVLSSSTDSCVYHGCSPATN